MVLTRFAALCLQVVEFSALSFMRGLFMRRFCFGLLLLLAGLGVKAARAEVLVHAMFSDHMVLQQQKKVPVWGTCTGPAEVTVKFGGQTVVASVKDGAWTAHLEPLFASAVPAELTVEANEAGQKTTKVFKDVLVGEVWLCSGQSNMQWTVKDSFEPEKVLADAKHDQVRLFTVNRRPSTKPESTFGPNAGSYDHRWVLSDDKTVVGFSAVGYHFGVTLQKALGVPVGLIHSSWGGTPAQAWTSQPTLDATDSLKYYHADLAKAVANFNPEKAQKDYETALEKHRAAVKVIQDKQKAIKEGKEPAPKQPLQMPRAPQKPVRPDLSQNSPSTLYNGMIQPLLPFAIAGAIWYQGESNAGKAYEYRTLMPTMIEDWRKAWGYEFPFMIVQLAPYMKIEEQPTESAWAELREAQFLTTRKLAKVGLAVITDVGEQNDIHPKQKQPVGERLAIAAQGIAYGKSIVYSGPVYQKLEIQGSNAVVRFDHLGGGLECRGDALQGFTICGEDKKFVNATAKIEGDCVVVSSPTVTKPVAVRYGWANFPVVNLWNKAGLPAVPFRTDDFAMTTMPKKK
jgi:sialate O-acetylesterase